MNTKPPTTHTARVFLHKRLYAVAKCACGYMARFYYSGGCKVITQGDDAAHFVEDRLITQAMKNCN